MLNIVLLENWCWKLLVDRSSSFWYRVLLAWYGMVNGRLEDGYQSCSLWWREIVKGGGGGEGGWFEGMVVRKVGMGQILCFGMIVWLVVFCLVCFSAVFLI